MKKVIVDCDAGYDDAIALILLISAHKNKELEIKGITCVSGNTVVHNVIRNVFRTLEACNALDIPVYQGAHSSLISVESSRKAENIRYHGHDGFGDVFTDDPDISKLQPEHAVIALHKIIVENAGEISVVCLGPLTNIALAIKLYPEILDAVKDFYIMGGNSAAMGNTTPQAEFNFYADPESVHIVLGSNEKPMWLVPWETCLKSDITNDWRDNILGKLTTKQMKLIDKVEKGIYTKKLRPEFYKPCDSFVTAVLINPDIIKKVTDFHADIELTGTKTRGQVVLDHLRQNKPNIRMIEDIHFKLYQDLMFSAFSSSL